MAVMSLKVQGGDNEAYGEKKPFCVQDKWTKAYIRETIEFEHEQVWTLTESM